MEEEKTRTQEEVQEVRTHTCSIGEQGDQRDQRKKSAGGKKDKSTGEAVRPFLVRTKDGSDSAAFFQQQEGRARMVQPFARKELFCLAEG